MNTRNSIILSIAAFSFILAGCTVRTYPVVKDRVDQNISSSAGNRGYLMGQPPAGEEKERKTTRTMRVFEIELGSPVKIEKRTQPLQEQGSPVGIAEQPPFQDTMGGAVSESPVAEAVSQEYYENYTVQKGDTLQKISRKYYGTTRQWKKIYEVNKNMLKSPDRIRPGQVIQVPVERLIEPEGNLK